MDYNWNQEKPAARHSCSINNEIAMAIYIYTVEELGKLILLRTIRDRMRVHNRICEKIPQTYSEVQSSF